MNNPLKTSSRSSAKNYTPLDIYAAIITAIFYMALTRPIPAAEAYLHMAHTTRVLNATDTAHLHYIHSSGSELIETGTATGTLPGNMNAHVSIGPTINGAFTITVHGEGSIKGRGSAVPSGSGTYESFSGSLTITGGTGRYTHAHGQAKLYGTFDRKTYALVVQTTGHLSY